MAQHIITGQHGEAIAAKYLREKGYDVRAANVQLGHDEVDLIAHDPRDDVLVFAEVKTRSFAHPDYWPGMNMTWDKKRAMTRAARKWVARHNYKGGYRLDLLCVAEGIVIDHIQQIEFTL